MTIDKFVIKVASRCNINCSYCYMYNMGDLSYKKQPKFINEETVKAFVEKLEVHVKKHEIKLIGIIIHGGEPLLMDKNELINFITSFNSLIENKTEVKFYLQTNAILIDDEWCDLFKKYKIDVGVSLDGSKIENDKFRIDKKGKGTYDDVINGINTLKKNNLRTGILSVMNLNSNPIEYYNHFKSLKINNVDIMLQDTNYDTFDFDFNKTKAADWYIEIFDIWFKEDQKKYRIGTFEDMIKEVLGESQGLDAFGIGENNVLVLETNGDLEALDVLKTCGDSFTKNGINVKTHMIDDVENSDLIQIYYKSGSYLPKKCLACPVQEICGGGYLPHRYSSENGFNNPSVYCNSILKLITHIQNNVIDAMPQDIVQKANIQKLTYQNALQIIEETLPNIAEPNYIEKLESFRKL